MTVENRLKEAAVGAVSMERRRERIQSWLVDTSS